MHTILPPKDAAPRVPHAKWLAAARLGWMAVTLLVLVLLAYGIPARFTQLTQSVDQRPLLELGIAPESYATYVLLLDVFIVLAHITIAAIIFALRPDDWMALFVSLTLVLNGSILPLARLSESPGINPFWFFLVGLLIYLGLVSSIVLLYIFPDGRFVPRATILLALSWAILMAYAVLTPGSNLSLVTWNPLIQFIILFAWAGTGLYAQVFRYQNVSRPIERQQTKWALMGLFAATVGPILVLISLRAGGGEPAVPNILYQRMGSAFFTSAFLLRLTGFTFFKLASLLFPISFAIAVLRYRLWDIDIIIRRTLIYSLITGTLTMIFLGSIMLLQVVFRPLTQNSQLAVVFSTLGTAALFVPLRRRIQAGIDRRFYRSRYDTEKILEAFSSSLRDQVDLDQLCDRLLVVVEDSMHPEHVSLWMVEPKDSENYAS
jgi:hypothetical protein